MTQLITNNDYYGNLTHLAQEQNGVLEDGEIELGSDPPPSVPDFELQHLHGVSVT
jgi:hypothetical protein